MPVRNDVLDVEAEDHHVAVLHHVILALHAQASRLLGTLLPTEGHIVVVTDGLGLDEAALEVGVDDAGRLGRLRSDADGPGTDLLRTGREEALQSQQAIGRLRERLEPRALETQ